ncbi:MAG TPA: gamma-glutamyltransferase [Polyangiaceae bacterium]|jgi:gamma-glutamyltranspeptidase/glutathione hydrolase
MRRWLRRIAIGLGLVLAILGALAWYLAGLPWRNRCAVPGGLVARAPHANSAVATSQPLATEAAAAVLRDGGSAVDAAIAAALMLGVVEPGNSGLGGGGFALIHDPAADKDVAIDFRERAPLGLDKSALDATLKKDPLALRNGPSSVAVPAEWAGLLELHRRWGRLPLSRLARPAIAAARAGVPIDKEYTARCWVRIAQLRADPEARATYLAGGLCPLPGWTLREPALADTLTALSDDQQPVSWEERVGRKLVAFMAGKQSGISARDLEGPRVAERPVVTGSFLGRRIVSMGPPSSGGIVLIGMLESYERMRKRLPKANPLHVWVEASRLAFYDRATLLGDPDFVTVPSERLLSAQYADAQAARALEQAEVALPNDASPRESMHTTHLSIVDKSGLAIALTQTINVPFGSGLVVPGTGVLLNDEMDDFYAAGPNAFGLLGNELNAPAPGKRPLSSMSPTFVFDGSELVLVLGSPGGSNIPTAVAWVIRAMIEGHLSAEDAIRSPRIHHQWQPPVLQVEPRFDRASLPPDLARIAKKPQFPVGRVQLLSRDAQGWQGVSDCRDQGEPWAAAL